MLPLRRMAMTIISAVILLATAATAEAQSFPPAARLTIAGIGAAPIELSGTDLDQYPRQSLVAAGKDGAQNTYSGVFLADVLVNLGVKLREQLKSPDLATYLTATGADGYTVLIALPEFDTGRLLIADEIDSKPLAAEDGPLRLISPDEARHSRWVRQLTRLTVQTAKP